MKYRTRESRTLSRGMRLWSLTMISAGLLYSTPAALAQSQECLFPCQLRTQTMGGWGAPAEGNNPGVYRDANFAEAFPSGLEIGCINKLRLTSAAAVEAFLPSGGTASVLPPGTLEDPGGSHDNVFAGQLVALKLSVRFDEIDPDFGAATSLLKDAVIGSGPFAGHTVEQIIELSDQLIGGCGGTHSPSTLSDILSDINENFTGGTTNNGLVQCEEIIITVSDILTCDIESVQLRIDDCIPVPGRTYAWTGPEEFESTDQCPWVTVGGHYEVVITDVSFGSATCEVEVEQNILKPPAECENATLYCLPATVQLRVNNCVENPFYSYEWSHDSSPWTSTLQCPNVSLPGIYTVVVTDSRNGCTSDCEVNVIDGRVYPDVAVTGNVIACGADCATLVASSTTAGVSFRWTPPTGPQSFGPELLVCAAGGPYTIRVTHDASGCYEEEIVNVQEMFIEVNAILTCDVEEVQIRLNNCIASAGRTYSWTGPGPFSSSVQCPFVSEPGTYQVTISDPAFGSVVCEVEVEQNIYYPPAICEGGTLYCVPGTVQLTVNDCVANPFYSYSWVSVPAGFSSMMQCPSVDQPGLYVVTVEDSRNGCETECEAVVIDGRVYPNVHVSGTEIACEADCTTLIASSTTPGVTFVWTRPDLSTSNGAELQVCTSGGPYSVRATHTLSGCYTDEIVYVTKEECECDLRTQTMGGWGSPANGNNPGVYRDAQFPLSFPDGLMIGCTRTLKLTTAAAVQAFLPSGTNARILNAGHMADPGQSYRNVLAGQLVALKLSVKFDADDADFAAGGSLLGEAEVLAGPFAGKTVSEIIELADQFIGGCGGPYTANQLNSVLSSINENFNGGTTDNGFLICPGATAAALTKSSMTMTDMLEYFELYPNPASDQITIKMIHGNAGQVQIDIIDLAGRKVMDLASYAAAEGEERIHQIGIHQMEQGAYLLILRQNGLAETHRFIVTR